MNLTEHGLKQFLRITHEGASSITKIVLGNESGDMDSVVASILYSFFLSTKKNEQILPVMNFLSNDLALRPETISVLNRANCNLSDLTFIDQVNFESSTIKQVHLVDHNRLSNRQKFLAPLVISVVDHHVDESEALIHVEDKKIELVGSACTLIAENILQEASIDASVARILLSAILSDTFNLEQNGGRTTPKDIRIAHQLAAIIDSTMDPEKTEAEIFTYTEDAKYNTKSMSSMDLLRKDYKQWEIQTDSGKVRMGISAAPITFQEWSSRTSILQKEFENYTRQNGLDVLLVMTMHNSPHFQRQLAVYSTSDKELYKSIITKLFEIENLNAQEIQLKEQNLTKDSLLSFYDTNVVYSRKKLSPVLSEHIKHRT